MHRLVAIPYRIHLQILFSLKWSLVRGNRPRRLQRFYSRCIVNAIDSYLYLECVDWCRYRFIFILLIYLPHIGFYPLTWKIMAHTESPVVIPQGSSGGDIITVQSPTSGRTMQGKYCTRILLGLWCIDYNLAFSTIFTLLHLSMLNIVINRTTLIDNMHVLS